MREKSLIAIGVDREGQLWSGHFGMSPQYYLYDFDSNLVEKRPNPYGAGDGAHHHHDNPRLIVDLLPECGVFIARRMGDDSKRNLAARLGIRPVITDEKEPQAALAAYLKGARDDEDTQSDRYSF